MIVDDIDFGLMVVDLIPGTEEYDGWRDYARFCAKNSPAIQEILDNYPEWYLAYQRLMSAGL
jgi:hypothetical protein